MSRLGSPSCCAEVSTGGKTAISEEFPSPPGSNATSSETKTSMGDIGSAVLEGRYTLSVAATPARTRPYPNIIDPLSVAYGGVGETRYAVTVGGRTNG